MFLKEQARFCMHKHTIIGMLGNALHSIDFFQLDLFKCSPHFFYYICIPYRYELNNWANK